MTLRSLAAVCRRNLRLHRPLQMGLIVVFWMAGQFLVGWSRLPLPGGIVGMFLVLALLASGRLSPASLQKGANWFLAEMLLFFVPAVLAMLDHREFLSLLGLKVLAVIVAGTLVVMIVTALSVDLCFRLLYAPGPNDHGANDHAGD